MPSDFSMNKKCDHTLTWDGKILFRKATGFNLGECVRQEPKKEPAPL